MTCTGILAFVLYFLAVFAIVFGGSIVAFTVGMPSPLYGGLVLLLGLEILAAVVGAAVAADYGWFFALLIATGIGLIFCRSVDRLVRGCMGTGAGIAETWRQWRRDRRAGIASWKRWTDRPKQ